MSSKGSSRRVSSRGSRRVRFVQENQRKGRPPPLQEKRVAARGFTMRKGALAEKGNRGSAKGRIIKEDQLRWGIRGFANDREKEDQLCVG